MQLWCCLYHASSEKLTGCMRVWVVELGEGAGPSSVLHERGKGVPLVRNNGKRSQNCRNNTRQCLDMLLFASSTRAQGFGRAVGQPKSAVLHESSTKSLVKYIQASALAAAELAD